jgi:hypothetical protein
MIDSIGLAFSGQKKQALCHGQPSANAEGTSISLIDGSRPASSPAFQAEAGSAYRRPVWEVAHEINNPLMGDGLFGVACGRTRRSAITPRPSPARRRSRPRSAKSWRRRPLPNPCPSRAISASSAWLTCIAEARGRFALHPQVQHVVQRVEVKRSPCEIAPGLLRPGPGRPPRRP